jgi:hypothetical protein
MEALKVGSQYVHYKNKKPYLVIAVAKHSETQEQLVVYRALYGDGQTWVRPLVMFTELVEYEGNTVPRFASR